MHFFLKLNQLYTNGPFSIANCWSLPEGKTWGRKASSFPMFFGPLNDPKRSRAYGIEDDFLTHATHTHVQIHVWKICQIRMLDRIVRLCYKYSCQYVSIYLPWWGSVRKVIDPDLFYPCWVPCLCLDDWNWTTPTMQASNIVAWHSFCDVCIW